MRIASLVLAVTLSGGYAYAAVLNPMVSAPADPAAALDSPFTLQADTQVPGKLLKAGNYRIAIKDHLSDRAILQVVNDSGKVQSTFLGLFHSGIQSTGSTGPILLPTVKGHPALRGFAFPGGGTIEFAYPKAEAADIASKSTDKVMAIDPESDNLKAQGASLSKEDAQVVTLWSLQATKVGPDGKSALQASKFVAPASESAPVVASVTPSAPAAPPVQSTRSTQPPAASTTQAYAAPAPRKRAAPAPASQVASTARRPALAALPHTASNMPLLLLTAIMSFVAAGLFRLRRWLTGAV